MADLAVASANGPGQFIGINVNTKTPFLSKPKSVYVDRSLILHNPTSHAKWEYVGPDIELENKKTVLCFMDALMSSTDGSGAMLTVASVYDDTNQITMNQMNNSVDNLRGGTFGLYVADREDDKISLMMKVPANSNFTIAQRRLTIVCLEEW
jgi:hypothetical protein